MTDKLERIWKEVVLTLSRKTSGDTEENTTITPQASLLPGRDFNPGFPEYEERMVRVKMPHCNSNEQV
jgi:hypothetical protein